MKTKNIISSIIVLVLAAALGVGLLTGVNSATAPIIAENEAGQANEALLAILPEGTGFELLYSAEDPSASALTDVPATVVSIYEETSGLGWAITLSTTEGYTGEPMELAVGIDTEGRISTSQVLTYPDSKDFDQAVYPASFVGQDSTLADVGLVSGVTFSSKAYRNAVNDAFTALIANSLIGEAQKSDAQVLMELVINVHPGLYSADVAQTEEFDAGDEAVLTALKAKNDSGCAMIFTDGSSELLAVTNASNCVTVYNAEGADVTDSVDAALLEKLAVISAANLNSFEATTQKRLASLVSETAALEPLSLTGVYSTVTEVYRITDGEEVYTGFAARPYAYSNAPIYYYVVLDAQGAIKAMTVDTEEQTGTAIIAAEYFPNWKGMDEGAYRAGLEGLTVDTYTGEQTLIAGATFSSNAAQTALQDVFGAYATLSQNGGLA